MSDVNKQKMPDFSNIRNMPELNKSIEYKEQIKQRVRKCSIELEEALRQHSCVVNVIPKMALDDNGRLRVEQQIYVRHVKDDV